MKPFRSDFMKFKLLFVAFLVSAFSWGQVTEGFEGTTTPPTDWTYNSVTHETANFRSGSRCAGFNANADAIISPLVANPNQLSFWWRRSGTSPTSPQFTVQYGSSTTGPWTDVSTGSTNPITNFTTTYQEFTADLSSLTNVYIRVLHSRTAGANIVYIDDFSITVISGYTVTFNGNGATSGTMANQTASIATALTANAFVRTGYTFGGWSTTAGGALAYNDGASYPFTSNQTLYAIWTPNNNTITFNGNGSTGGTTANQTLATGATANLNANGYVRTGYSFGGWATSAAGSAVYADGASYTMGTSSLTLFAVWQTTSPFISTSGTLSALSTTYGTASSNTTFTISAGNLTNNLIIAPPTGFVVSTSPGTGFTASLNLGAADRTNTIIYVRLAETTPAGTYNGNINLTSTGAPSATVATASSIVNPKALTITGLTANAKVYDGTTTASVTGTAAYSGLENGETFTVSGSASWVFSSKDFGTPVTLTRTGNYLAPSSNYTITQPTLSANITKRPLTITAPSIASKVYDGSAVSGAVTAGTLSNLVGTETLNVTATGLYADPDAAIGKTATVAYLLANGTNGGLAINYSLANGTGTGDITKANPVFTVSTISVGTGGSYALPGANVASTSPGALTYSITGGGFATLSGTTINGVGVGTETLTVNQAASTNYNAGSTTVSVNVTTTSYPYNSFLSTTGSGVYTNTTSVWSKCGNTGGCTGTTIGAGGWGALGASGQAPIATSTAFVQGNITGGATGITNMTILSGGTLTTSAVYPVSNSLTVKTGGTLIIGSNLNFNNTSATFTVEDGADVIINTTTSNPNTSLWNGVEVFSENSNVIYNYGRIDTEIFTPETVISTNPATGAKFGNLTLQPTTLSAASGNWTGIFPNGTYTLTKKNLTINNSTDRNFTFNGGAITVGGNMTVDVTSTGEVATRSSAGTASLSVNGNLTKNGSGMFRLNGGGDYTLNVDGDIQINAGTFRTGVSISGSVITTVNLKGDLTAAATALLDSNNTNIGVVNFNFNGAGDGLTPATTQTVDIATTVAGENRNTSFNVKSGAYVQLINRNFELGANSKLTVDGGAVLDFGFTGTTPLLVGISGSQTGTAFASLTGSTLKITSPDGISTTGTVGNVQVVPANISFDPLATFHYIGKANQVTGNGIGSTTNGKAVIVELDTNSLQLSPSQSFGITNNTNANINAGLGGILDIRRGRFIESTTAYITGSSGGLSMATGTYYQIPALSSSSSDLIPRMSGLSNAYNLLGTSTIELNGADGANPFDQYFRGQRTYRNLIFSNAGVKTLSSGITNTNTITGTVTVKDSAVLDVVSNTLGGVGTNLTMTDTAQYKTSGVGTKPDPEGTYSLGLNTKIEFYEADTSVVSNTIVRLGSPTAINYANVIVNGPRVLNNSTNNGLLFQTGGTFTVKNNAVFKLMNTAGFYDGTSTVTAVKNTNTPTITLENGSAIDYAGDNQTICFFNQNANPSTLNYTNLTISGSNTSTKTVPTGSTNVFVNENLNVVASRLLLNANEAITVKKAVSIAAANAEFEIKNNGQLIQIDDADANSGTNFKMERIAQANKLDYVYWTSPTFNSFDMANVPSNGLLYEWNTTAINANTTQGGWRPASGNMIRGKGYAIGVPYSLPARPAAAQSVTTNFTGKPNNGQFTYTIYRGNYDGPDYDADLTNPSNLDTTKYDDNWNLVGNPYPSAISASKFLNLNAGGLGSTGTDDGITIAGTIWIWRHGQRPDSAQSPFYNTFTNNYYSSDYIKFNELGASDPSFSGFIGAGQGFMVNMKENTGTLVSTASPIRNSIYSSTITFNNSLRSANTTYAPYNNGNFYRTNPDLGEDTQEKHRIWMDIINTQSGQTDTTLLGYAENATLGEDNLFDAIFIPRGEVNLFSIIDNKPFIIQGRPLPFDENDKVPMGINIVAAGSHTIAIRKVDGIFEDGVTIYLEDKLLNTIHNLKTAPYVFTSDRGVFNDRFVVRYTNSTLGNPDFGNLESSVVVATNKGEMTIKSFVENIQDVTVYDILGRQLLEAKNVQNNNFAASNISNSQQALIVKIKLANGLTVTKKIVL